MPSQSHRPPIAYEMPVQRPIYYVCDDAPETEKSMTLLTLLTLLRVQVLKQLSKVFFDEKLWPIHGCIRTPKTFCDM